MLTDRSSKQHYPPLLQPRKARTRFLCDRSLKSLACSALDRMGSSEGFREALTAASCLKRHGCCRTELKHHLPTNGAWPAVLRLQEDDKGCRLACRNPARRVTPYKNIHFFTDTCKVMCPPSHWPFSGLLCCPPSVFWQLRGGCVSHFLLPTYFPAQSLIALGIPSMT